MREEGGASMDGEQACVNRVDLGGSSFIRRAKRTRFDFLEREIDTNEQLRCLKGGRTPKSLATLLTWSESKKF